MLKHYSEFLSAKFDNVSSTFFKYHLGQKFFNPQTVLGQWRSSLDPQFLWISPCLGWKAIYVETVYSEFLRHNYDYYYEYYYLALLLVLLLQQTDHTRPDYQTTDDRPTTYRFSASTPEANTSTTPDRPRYWSVRPNFWVTAQVKLNVKNILRSAHYFVSSTTKNLFLAMGGQHFALQLNI